MIRSIIVYGPQGCGKTRNAEGIKKYFGLGKVVEMDEMEFRNKPVIDEFDVLYLTNDLNIVKRENTNQKVMLVPYQLALPIG